jgi:hypothetical protein
VEGFFVVRGDLLVTLPAECEIIGGALYNPLVGGILVVCLVVSLVALDAALLEVLVRLDELAIDEEGQVEGLRLDRRRRPRSPLPLALGDDKGLAGLLERRLVCVACDAAALVLGGCRRGQKKNEWQEKRSDQDDEPGLHGSSWKMEEMPNIVTVPRKLSTRFKRRAGNTPVAYLRREVLGSPARGKKKSLKERAE